ncbi:hypothetical protein PMAYCL1PPCAC_24530, partial [Pristionchus mayeri]
NLGSTTTDRRGIYKFEFQYSCPGVTRRWRHQDLARQRYLVAQDGEGLGPLREAEEVHRARYYRRQRAASFRGRSSVRGGRSMEQRSEQSIHCCRECAVEPEHGGEWPHQE